MREASDEDLDVSKISQTGENFAYHHCPNNSSSAIKKKSEPDTDCIETEISGTTNICEPHDWKDNENVARKGTLEHSKAASYQDIHSEYTKRRYRNVESKVAKYIANMKAQDKTRRNSRISLSHGTLPQTNDRDSHMKGSLAIMSPPSDDAASNSRESSSDGIVYVEKNAYEQLLKCKETYDYLEVRLEEKHADNCRLKKNIDLLRIELSQCKDKLKQKAKHSKEYSSDIPNSVATLSKCATYAFLYPSEKVDQTIQTDITLTASSLPSRLIHKSTLPTPLTPESHNTALNHNALGVQAPIKIYKTTAAIQPLSLNFSTLEEHDLSRDHNANTTLKFLRHCSNSMTTRKKSTPILANNSHLQNSNNNISEIQNDITTAEPSVTSNSLNQAATPSTRYKLRRIPKRIKRIFGFCTKCHEENDTLDNTTVSTQQQSYTHIPLLEKSLSNHCHNNTR